MNKTVTVLVVLAIVIGFVGNAYAHTTVEVEPYEIEVGWDIEPPVVGFRNAIVYEISESPSEGVKSGIINAFKNLQSTIRLGGVTKVLDINSDPRPGNYFSKIIPTKTGSLSIELKGEINGVPVDIELPVEAVEGTAVLDFPSSSGSASGQDQTALKNALSSIQKDVISMKTKLEGISTGSASFDVETAYNFAVFALSISVAAIVLAIIGMLKRK